MLALVMDLKHGQSWISSSNWSNLNSKLDKLKSESNEPTLSNFLVMLCLKLREVIGLRICNWTANLVSMAASTLCDVSLLHCCLGCVSASRLQFLITRAALVSFSDKIFSTFYFSFFFLIFFIGSQSIILKIKDTNATTANQNGLVNTGIKALYQTK